MLNQELAPATSDRVPRSLALRTQTAGSDAFAFPPLQNDNGDEARYSDKSGTYTKGILQDSIGLVNAAAYRSFKQALASGDPADFANIITGGPRTQNGPQGGLAFYLDSLDSSQLAVPRAPALASEEYATELVELYWASLLRDVPFTSYGANPVAVQAAAELSSLPTYAGPKSGGAVTPEVLFRGIFAGELAGPYISQFLVQPTNFGALPIVQQYQTNAPNINFMLDPTEFQKVQNGIATGKVLTSQAPVYLHDGRGLSAYTHQDVLYEAYFIAFLVLTSLGLPVNPGNPYVGSKTQNGFATFGGPDFASTLAAVAGSAIRAVWYLKWWVHLRHRPESGGAIVHLLKTGQCGSIEGHVSDTVLNSKAVAASHAANGNSFFLSQAFPEGSPTHPAYPTGHGAVAGACITVLKFFFDGEQTFSKPLVSANGTATALYTGPDANTLTVNGELHKLASNISFGHGVHAGIHWRSDTLTSIQFGEAVALSYLRDHAHTYNERFSVTLTKLDGSKTTISNHAQLIA